MCDMSSLLLCCCFLSFFHEFSARIYDVTYTYFKHLRKLSTFVIKVLKGKGQLKSKLCTISSALV